MHHKLEKSKRAWKGSPQHDSSGLIFHCGSRSIFTMVEDPWPNTAQKARVSFNVDRRKLYNHHRSLFNTA